MATPRKRWFKVADSILREPWTAEERGIILGVCAYLHQRWSRDGIDAETAGEASLTNADLHAITGRSHRPSSLKSLSNALDLVTSSVKDCGKTVEISWPKFAEFQELSTRPAGNVRGATAPSETETETETEKKKKRRRKTVAKRAKKASPSTAESDEVERQWAPLAALVEQLTGARWVLTDARRRRLADFIRAGPGDPDLLVHVAAGAWAYWTSLSIEEPESNVQFETLFVHNRERALETYLPRCSEPVRLTAAAKDRADEAEGAAIRAERAARGWDQDEMSEASVAMWNRVSREMPG